MGVLSKLADVLLRRAAGSAREAADAFTAGARDVTTDVPDPGEAAAPEGSDPSAPAK